MSGDELSYVPTAMSQLHGNNTLIAGISASNMHPQGGSKRFSRRPRAMLDKQVNLILLKQSNKHVNTNHHFKPK